MGELVQEAIVGLKDMTALRENSNDSIWIAGDLLSRFHTNDGFKSGFSHIDAEIITAEDAKNLKQAVLDAISKCSHPATKGSLIYALRLVRDPNLRSFCVEQLEDALRLMEGSSNIIGCCLDYLSNLGEDVYELKQNGTYSGSMENDHRQARKYIERLNPTMLIPFPFDRKIPKDT